MAADAGRNVRERAFSFGCQTARFVMALAPRSGVRSLADQLIRCATSIGANLEEAKAASSRREFIRYLEMALREGREAFYWLRLCAAVHVGCASEVRALALEADQLIRILTVIVVTTKRRAGKQAASASNRK